MPPADTYNREPVAIMGDILWRAGQEHAGASRAGSAGLQLLEFFAGFEPHDHSGRDLHFFPGTRIAADSRLAGPDAEHTEAAELNAIAAAHGLLQRLEDGLNRLFGLGAADTRRADDGVHDIELDHAPLPGCKWKPMLDMELRVVKGCAVS